MTWNDGQGLRAGIGELVGNRQERRAVVRAEAATHALPAPKRPVDQMTSAVEVDLYRKEVGAFIQVVIQRLRAHPPAFEREALARAQQRAVALTKELRTRANELNAQHGGRDGTRDEIAVRGAVNIIGELLDIIDRYQDAGAPLTDEEIGTLDGAATWRAKYSGEPALGGDDE